MNEYTTYKPIKGYPGYAINEIGEVISTKGKKPHTLQPYVTTSRYLCVALQKEGSSRGRMMTVHSLVAQAFLGDRPKGMVIDHIDGNRFNNHYTNLRYCTQKENVNNPNSQKPGKKRNTPAIIATKEGEDQSFEDVQAACKALDLNARSVLACLHGKAQTHGYTFRYA